MRNITKTDDFGHKAIAVFGDSITHGANCPDIAAQSYIGILKQKLKQTHGLQNYGYTLMESSMWNAHGRYDEMHQVRMNEPWQELREDKYLGTYALRSEKAGSKLTVTLSQPHRYAYIYYACGQEMGAFTATCGNRSVTANCKEWGTTLGPDGPGRIGPLVLQDTELTITALDDDPIVICGIGYYNDLQGLVVNNYANNGLRLVGLRDELLEIMANVDTAIFSLGYNDSHFPTDEDEFSHKIDVLVNAFNRNGTQVYVNDLCWNLPESNHFRREIKRLAAQTRNAVYIPQVQAIMDKGLLDTVGAHPNVEGHALIAEALLAAMAV